MRLLITGGSGFVGWNAVRHFVDGGHDVVATYRFSSHYLHHVARCQPVELDLADGSAIDSVVARFQPDCIIHTAACARPQDSHDEANVLAVNVAGTERLAGAARRAGAGLVYLSTDLVYSAHAGCCNERTPTDPSGAGAYSRSKLLGEEALRASGARWIILRCALMFGSGTPTSNSFTQFLDRRWSAAARAPVFSDQHRSFLHVGDLVRAVEQVAIVAPAWDALFVCGGPERLSRAAFALRYAEARDVDRELCDVMRSSDLDGYVGGGSDISLDSSKLHATGWQPRSLDECFRAMVRGGVID